MHSSRSRLGLNLAAAVLLAAVVVTYAYGRPAAQPAEAALAGQSGQPTPTAAPIGTEDVLSLLRAQQQAQVLPANAPRTTATPFEQVPLTPSAGPGELDPTFGTRGVTITRFAGQAIQANDLVVLPDGSIVTAGGDRNFESAEFVLVKYHCDGTLDTSFGEGGRVVTPLQRPGGGGVQGIALDPKGRLVAVGTAGLGGLGYGFAVARYLPNGQLDRSFGNGGVVVAQVGPLRRGGATDVVVLPDGRILVAGGANDIRNGIRIAGFAAARFLTDGRLDPSFGTNGSAIVPMPGGDASAFALGVQRDGRAVLGGVANNLGATSFALTRLTREGQLDQTFGDDGIVVQTFPDSGINGINDLVLDDQGRIVAAGLTGNPLAITDFGLMRFRPDGSLDPTFGGGTGMVRTEFGGNATVSGVLLRPDGGLVAAGQAWPNIALVGYLADGSLDENFGAGGRTLTAVEAISAASAAALQFNKRIVISGLTGNETLSDAAFLVARYGLVKGPLPDGCERIPSVQGLG